jgi:nucleoside-diphosphate-sugar epimerase
MAGAMKIAVTGASGFIGRHVLSELASHPVDVIAVTRDTARLADFASPLTVVKFDLATSGQSSFEQLGRPDVLIHLSWEGLPHYKSLHHFDKELPRQYQFLKHMVEGGLPALLVTGTCFEYGMRNGPLSEEMSTCPTNPYGYAKDALRKQLEFLQAERPFALTWARLFYLYGEGQAAGSLFSQLSAAATRGDSIFNLSGGEQLRDYLPATDVARYIVRLATARQGFGPVNICSGKPVSVRSLVEKWRTDHAWKIDLKFGHYPYPDYEPMAFWGDASRIRDICKATDSRVAH